MARTSVPSAPPCACMGLTRPARVGARISVGREVGKLGKLGKLGGWERQSVSALAGRRLCFRSLSLLFKPQPSNVWLVDNFDAVRRSGSTKVRQAKPGTYVEIALTKTNEARERQLYGAMPAVQRQGLKAVEKQNMQVGAGRAQEARRTQAPKRRLHAMSHWR